MYRSTNLISLCIV